MSQEAAEFIVHPVPDHPRDETVALFASNQRNEFKKDFRHHGGFPEGLVGNRGLTLFIPQDLRHCLQNLLALLCVE